MRIVYLLILLNLCTVVEGAIVTGALRAGSGMADYPVEGADITLRIGNNPDLYPTGKSDANGQFVIEVQEMPGLLMVWIEKEGLVRRELSVYTQGNDTVNLGVQFLGQIITSVLSFRGELLDSITYEPIVGATVRFRRSVAVDSAFTEVVTDSDGYFSVELTVWNDVDGKAYWCIEHPGYRVGFGEVTSKMTISRYTIELVPHRDGQMIVKGRVIDSLSRKPHNNLKVVISTSYFESTVDTVTTGDDGTFTAILVTGGVGAMIPMLYCSIYAENYLGREIEITMPGNPPLEYDVGDVAVLIDKAGIHSSRLITISASTPQSKQVFLLDGRMVPGMNRLKSEQKNTASQIAVIRREKSAETVLQIRK